MEEYEGNLFKGLLWASLLSLPIWGMIGVIVYFTW